MSHVVIGIITRKNSVNQTEFLLVSSKRDFGEFSGRYYPPGGHLEDGEDEQTALIREIKEETGLDVMPVKRIAETAADVKDQTTYWWLCDIQGGELHFQKDELADAGWFTAEVTKRLPLWPMVEKVFTEHNLWKP